MWQETKHGLYKQFNFSDFREAFAFMTKVAAEAERLNHHPRWENEWSVVQIWLSTHEGDKKITEKDRELAQAIDALVSEPSAEHKVLEPVAPPARVKDAKAARAHKKLTLYADGGSRGNPGPSASGYVIYGPNDETLVDRGVYLGITTNNQAEYTALKLALQNCRELGAQEVDVYMDSLLVINQMKGIFKVKNRDLWPIHDAIKDLASHFKKVTFTHVPREMNKAADAAVNRAMDEALGIRPS